MKALSSAIIVAAGLFAMSASPATIRSLQEFLAFVAGAAATGLGLVAWWTSLKHER